MDARASGNFNGVEGPLRAALQLDPNFVMAQLKLGEYYMDLAGDDGKALEWIESAYRARDRVTDRERHFIAAQYFSAHQQFEEARDSLKALTSLYPDDPDFRYELALAYYALEQLPFALNELRQAIRFNPHGARVHGTLLLLLARDNQTDAALESFTEARRAGVDSPYLYWATGLARLARLDFTGAHADFDALSRGGGYYAHLGRLQNAKALLFEGSVTAAMAQLDELAELARREEDSNIETVARVQLARALATAGNHAAARQQASAAAALSSSGGARPNLIRDAGVAAHVARDSAQLAQQLTRLRQLEAANGTRLATAARLLLEGLTELNAGRFASAATAFADSYSMRPWYECRLFQAQALDALGHRDVAFAAWQGVLRARGQILQDGFPPDLSLAEKRTRDNARAGKG